MKNNNSIIAVERHYNGKTARYTVRRVTWSGSSAPIVSGVFNDMHTAIKAAMAAGYTVTACDDLRTLCAIADGRSHEIRVM